MNKYSKYTALTIICALTIFISSCASTSRTVRPRTVGPQTLVQQPTMPGVAMDRYHTVGPGETIWRISQMYGVDVNTIMRANRISDAGNIEIGQRILIPGAMPRKNVVTLYPSTKWKYIIIHHSATDMGNAEAFYNAHKQKGWETVGYHFVIDNGSCGKDAGQIETTPRWIKQMSGAHCKAGGMNETGIGICLVGNFSDDRLDPRQMNSLVMLVNELRQFYRIPNSNIMGHSDVPGAQTECPGTKFPWKDLWARIGR